MRSASGIEPLCNIPFLCCFQKGKILTTHKSARGGGSILISIFKPGIVHIFGEPQEGTNGVEDEARFGLVDDLIVVSQTLIVTDMIEFVEYADCVLHNLLRHLA